MKKSDIAMIILIASISSMTAFFVAKAIFGDEYSGTATVKTIEKFDSSIVEPSEEIFNEDAINPAVKIQIDGTDTESSGSGS